MAKNVGKKFEEDFIKSVPEDVILAHRLADSASSFGGCNNLRFSNKNPCDFFLFDDIHRILYTLELKSVQGKSISFERTSEDKGVIHLHQIDGLSKFDRYQNVISGFIINFREIEKTVFLSISEFNKLKDNIDKKSFNINDLDRYNYIEIEGCKKRTRYTYNIEKFVSDCQIVGNTFLRI